MKALPLNPLRGLGLYAGLLHSRANKTTLMADDGFGNLIRTDRLAAYNSALPNGHCAASRAVHTSAF